MLLRRVRHVVTEDVRTRAAVAGLRAGDWNVVSAAMTASHTSMRDDYEICCPELDMLVAGVRRAFAEQGYDEPTSFVARAAGGAGRVA